MIPCCSMPHTPPSLDTPCPPPKKPRRMEKLFPGTPTRGRGKFMITNNASSSNDDNNSSSSSSSSGGNNNGSIDFAVDANGGGSLDGAVASGFNFSGQETCFELLHCLPVDGVPQNMARCEEEDVILVSDVQNHRIHKYKGREYMGKREEILVQYIRTCPFTAPFVPIYQVFGLPTAASMFLEPC